MEALVVPQALVIFQPDKRFVPGDASPARQGGIDRLGIRPDDEDAVKENRRQQEGDDQAVFVMVHGSSPDEGVGVSG
jgi:hypothetical protein